MGWNIFRVRNQKRAHKPDDTLQAVINRIEKFAPRQYLQEREMYYYHYRQINRYFKPLLALLVHVSEVSEKGQEEEIFIQGLFRRLKDFYDVNDMLTMKEAVQDYSLKVKLLKLLKIFYNNTTLIGAELEGYLEKIEDN
jgi:hypothetical protein